MVKILVTLTSNLGVIIEKAFPANYPIFGILAWAQNHGNMTISMKPLRKIYCEEIRLNMGGYDSLGTYYGHFKRLYSISDENSNHITNIRASSRGEAQCEFADKTARFEVTYFWAWERL